MGKYILVKNLEVYKLARELSSLGWKIYNQFNWETKNIIGFQFIKSVDSVGANIAEGYSRFHYLDKIKFFYNSRASLSEAADHWIELLKERGKIDEKNFKRFKFIAGNLFLKLNNFINSIYKVKNRVS